MDRLHATSRTTIGTRRDGRPRVWLEGPRLDRCGFVPSARYDLVVDEVASTILLRLDPQGGRMVSRRVRDGSTRPIVEIASMRDLSMFDGVESLMVRFEEGRIVMSVPPSDARRAERSARLRRRIKNGEPLRVGSVSTGIGVLALAMHQGLADAGLDSGLSFSVEIDQSYQDRSMETNPAWRPDTLAVSAPLQEIAFDARSLAELPAVDVLEAGIPCTAHSNAGRAKKSLSMPEDDPNAGHLVAGFLAIVAACNPSILVVENVPQYATSASFAIMRNQLLEWGYDVRSTILRGARFGCLESRDRMALVATIPGIDLDLESLAPADPPKRTLSEILEDIPENDSRWNTMAGLKAKAARDLEQGKSFRMQTFGPEDRHVSTIGRGYSKVRSTEPKIRHPSDPGLLRQLTPAEHARIKGVPEAMVKGLGVTAAHEMLGQSVLVEPFRILGRGIGRAVSTWTEREPVPIRRTNTPPSEPSDCLPLFAAA